jgi:hypothetical protein
MPGKPPFAELLIEWEDRIQARALWVNVGWPEG